MVVEAHIFYKRAARFDEELTLRTKLAELKRATLRFEYELLRGAEVISTGYTRHGCIEIPTGRPTRIPAELNAYREPSPRV